MRKLVLVLAGLFVASAAAAGDSRGRFQIIGAGAFKCSAYLQATPEQRKVVETWWAGYTTAMNRSTASNYHLLASLSIEEANAWLQQRCESNPDELIAIAVHRMLEAAYPNRRQQGPE